MRSIRILPRAESDAQSIFEWIRPQSPEGALRWWTAFEHAQVSVAENSEAFGFAPENELFELELRQKIFKTAKGRSYRFVYTIREDIVFILRVRGPGQAPLSADEIKE